MWTTPFKSRIHSYHLDSVVDNLEAAGLLTDLSTLLKKSKSLIQPPNLKEMLTVLKTLTEEIWNEGKKLENPDPAVSTSKFLNSSYFNKSQNNSVPAAQMAKSSNSIIRKIDLPSPRPSSQYKLQVSQEVAYMSTFSFPKGCGTFYKSRKVPYERVADVPGPGSYFCDPRMSHSKSSTLTPNSARKLSLSLLKY